MKRKTSAQKKAFENYQFQQRQEDRYLGSVFVTSKGQKEYEERVKAAYDTCKALGMTYEHGL